MTAYHIGMNIPAAQPIAAITSGPEWPPTWFCLTVAPQRERATREYLRLRDIYAFYPSQERIRTAKGKQITTERPIVSGYVYAQFRAQPEWSSMKRIHRLITGVFCSHGVPVEISPDVIRHLQGLTVESDRLRMAQEQMAQAIRDAKRPRAGESARFTSGPLEGFMVDVQSVSGGVAWVTSLLGRVQADIALLERHG